MVPKTDAGAREGIMALVDAAENVAKKKKKRDPDWEEKPGVLTFNDAMTVVSEAIDPSFEGLIDYLKEDKNVTTESVLNRLKENLFADAHRTYDDDGLIEKIAEGMGKRILTQLNRRISVDKGKRRTRRF